MTRATVKSTNTTTIESTTCKPSLAHQLKYKKLFSLSLVTVALALGACTQEAQESSVHEFDFQTSEEEAAAEVAASNAPMIVDREDNPIAPSQDEPANTGAVAETADTVSHDAANTTVGSANTDDAESVDGAIDAEESAY